MENEQLPPNPFFSQDSLLFSTYEESPFLEHILVDSQTESSFVDTLDIDKGGPGSGRRGHTTQKPEKKEDGKLKVFDEVVYHEKKGKIKEFVGKSAKVYFYADAETIWVKTEALEKQTK